MHIPTSLLANDSTFTSLKYDKSKEVDKLILITNRTSLEVKSSSKILYQSVLYPSFLRFFFAKSLR